MKRVFIQTFQDEYSFHFDLHYVFSVSYTHLDVYKRQVPDRPAQRLEGSCERARILDETARSTETRP